MLSFVSIGKEKHTDGATVILNIKRWKSNVFASENLIVLTTIGVVNQISEISFTNGPYVFILIIIDWLGLVLIYLDLKLQSLPTTGSRQKLIKSIYGL